MARGYSKKKPARKPPTKPLVAAISKRKRPFAKRKQWTRAQMDAAMKAVLIGSADSINAAARDHGVPPTTLKNRLSGRVLDGTNPGPVPYLSNEEEQELEEYLTEANKVGYGRTRRQVKVIAERVATEKGVLRGARISDGWWRRFLQRHPNLSLRSGDSTGYVRMNAMNRENLKHYFDLLKSVLEENNLMNHPEQIYNMDETGIPLNPKPPKVVALRGQKKVRYQCSGAKSQITVLGCSSGTGHVIPPFVIFDAKQLNHLWTRGEVAGTRYGLSDSGWIDRGLFYGWLEEHFLTHAVPARPLLLLVDGHSSHYDPDAIRFSRDRSVIIFCIPPHTTHEAQPLDVGFFGPLKKNWSTVCHDFIQSSPGKVITKYNFSELFSKAWLKTCLPEIICSGFKKAGIIPFNPEALMNRCPGSDGSVEVRRNVPHFTSHNADDYSSGDEAEKARSSADSSSAENELSFSNEKEELFRRRFDEGYDVYDDNEYILWLRSHHPNALPSSQSSVSGVQPIAPVSEGEIPRSAHHSSSSELSFSNELFRRRFEEGYDVYDDDEYILWLRSNHPNALPNSQSSVMDFFSGVQPIASVSEDEIPRSAHHSSSISPASQSSDSSCLPLDNSSSSDKSSSSSSSSSSNSRSSSSHGSSSALAPETPSSSSSPLLFSSPEVSIPCTPTNNSASASSPYHTPSRKRSPLASITNHVSHSTPNSGKLRSLSKFLEPIVTQEKAKTGHARVLTSVECIQSLEEKQKKKEQEAQEKEERKKERERRKIEKEELLQKKKEERLVLQKQRQQAAAAKKAAATARKEAAALRRRPITRAKRRAVTRSTAVSHDPTSSATASASCESAASPQSTPAPDTDSSAQVRESDSVPHIETAEETCECAFCYGGYTQDGEEWVKCACGRWVHERCMEEVILDDDGAEKFCPFCLN